MTFPKAEHYFNNDVGDECGGDYNAEPMEDDGGDDAGDDYDASDDASKDHHRSPRITLWAMSTVLHSRFDRTGLIAQLATLLKN